MRSALSRPVLETILATVAGALVLNAVGFPAATLSGAMIGGTLLLVAGRPVALPRTLRDTGMLLGGVTMGSAVTPEMIAGIARYPASLLLMVCSVLATMFVGQMFLMRFSRMDRATALFASTPGALTSVLAVAADTRADMNRIVIIQALRLFVLVAILPSLVSWWDGAARTAATPPPATPAAIAAMVAAGAAVGLPALRLRLAAAWLLGGMLGSAILHGSGAVVGELPWPLTHFSFWAVGTFVATRFSTVRGALFRRYLSEALASLVVAMAIGVAFAALAARLTGKSFAEALVAFAPGGLEAMLILGTALDLDPVYVGLHHLLRFFGIGLLIPFAAPLFRERPGKNVSERDRSSTDVNE
jgi:hypothetical protein